MIAPRSIQAACLDKASIDKARWILLPVACIALCGCLGAPIAQQIASSILMNAADKVAEHASNAYDARQVRLEQEARNIKLEDTPPDPFWAAFVTTGLAVTKAEPSDDAANNKDDNTFASADSDTALARTLLATQQEAVQSNQALPFNAEGTRARIESSHLVKVEVWNLLIGSEKMSVLQKAQQLGSTQLPAANEWASWQVATGALDSDHKKMITFLIPPDYGRLVSGEQAIVEIASVGGLHIARYPAN